MFANALPKREVGHDTLPVCLGRENPHRLASLWDMLQVLATRFLTVGEIFQAIRTNIVVVAAPQKGLNDQSRSELLSYFTSLKTDCDMLALASTRDMLAWIIQDYSANQHTYGEVRSTVINLSAIFQQELNRHVFLHVDSENSRYMLSVDDGIRNPPFGFETARSFPHALRDMLLAGNCFACGYNDACVFHLMRVLEKGLEALAGVFSEPFKYENWHHVIERLESKIRKIDPSLGQGWKEQQKFYAETACEFMFFKDAWRNHVMHGRDEFDPERAKNIYDHVCGFMKQLARGGLTE